MGKFSGGNASRAEVYGLFFAAIVVIGGGIGGAVAATGGFNQISTSPAPSTTEVPSPTQPMSTSEPQPPSSSSATATPQQTFNPDPARVELPRATTPPLSDTFIMPNIVGTSYRVSSDYLLNTVGHRGGFSTLGGCFGLAPFEIKEQSPAPGSTVNKNQVISVTFQSGMIPCIQ